MITASRRGTTLVLTVDRPRSKNALTRATIAELTRAFSALPSDVRAVVLTGAGGTFVSGGDLRELRGVNDHATTRAFCDEGRAMCDAIEEASAPVLCAIEGHALGGGAELACAADLRVMAEDAVLGFRQTRMGVTTAWGTWARLAAELGPSRAADLVLTARDLTAREALDLGLVQRTAAPGGALAEALVVAGEIAAGAPRAASAVKELLRASRRSPELRALERERFVDTWTSDDHARAVEAWFEGRPPRWGG